MERPEISTPMPELLPPVRSAEAFLDQNKLSAAARATLALTWNRGVSVSEVSLDLSSPERLEIPVDDETYLDFWENGAVAPMGKFTAVAEEANKNPEKFNRLLIRDVSAFAPPLNGKFNHCLSDKFKQTEAEAIRELDGFLETVIEVSANNDPDIFDQAQRLRQELGYLDENAFEKGVELMAGFWGEYLRSNPDAYLNIYIRPTPQNGNKSFEYVLEKIQANLAQNYGDEARRVIDNPDNWQSTTGSKLIVVDDWVISGKSVSKLTSQALREAQQRGIGMPSPIEVHSIAREATAEISPGIQYRSVFLHDSGASYEQVSMIGSHSSVNYGFEYPMREMQKYLQDQGVFIPSPLLMAMEPVEYRDSRARSLIRADVNGQLMSTIAAENRDVLETLSKIYQLEKSVYDKTSGTRQNISVLRKALDGNNDSSLIVDESVQRDVDTIVKLRVALRSLSETREALREKLGLSKSRV